MALRLAAFTIHDGIKWKVKVASGYVASVLDHHGHTGAWAWQIQPNGDIRVTILRPSYGADFIPTTHNAPGAIQ